MIIYHYERAGAAVCSRDRLEDAILYARQDYGWDIHFGHHRNLTEFGDLGEHSYRVVEFRWDGEEWKRTGRDWTIVPSEAIDPFPEYSRGK